MVIWREFLRGFTGRERRKYVRLPSQLNVDFQLDNAGNEIPTHKGITRDISPEGICLATDAFSKEEWDEIARKKRHLHLYIHIPAGDKEEKIKAEAEVRKVDVEAEVVWQEYEKIEEKNMCSLGLLFTKIEKNSHEIIRTYIADNLIAKYRSA